MPGKHTLEDALDILQSHLVSRGASGMAGLARAFKIVDTDGNRNLSRDEFKEALLIWDMRVLNEAQINLLMAHFDEDGDGMITYDEFLKGVRGPMNERRINLVKKAYAVLDSDGSGNITLGDIMAEYDATQHPDVKAGKKTEEAVFKDFLDSFEGPHGNKDGMVTVDEFIDYYSGISASIDDDEYFAFMMMQAWKITEVAGEFNLDAGRVDRLEGQLRDKLLQKKKERETEARCLVAAFRYFNTAGTNMVDSRCFARTVERFGLVLEEPEMEAWFSYYDKDGKGAINYEAFTAALYPDDSILVRQSGVPTTPNRQAGGSSGASPEVWRPSTRQTPRASHDETRPW